MNELKNLDKKSTIQKINRELSWLSFNERVLYEAMDSDVPVLERLRFLGIYSNNLDEFFRVRVGTLNRLISNKLSKNLDYNPKAILQQIYSKLKEDEKIFGIAFKDIRKELKEHNIFFLNEKNLEGQQRKWLKDYFNKEVRQGVTPLLFKENLKFPILRDKSIYLAIKMKLKSGKIVYSLIEVPTDYYPRFIEVPSKDGKHYVIFLDDLIRMNLFEIYKVFDIEEIQAYTIKLTRDAELEIDNDITKSDIEQLYLSLKQRKRGLPVRFIADKNIPEDLLKFLLLKNNISKQNAVLSGKYHNFKDFMKFPNFGKSNLLYPKAASIPNLKFENSKTILKTIEERDVLLFYPYNSFDYLLNFLREASIDPEVETIKMSLYRLSKKSQIANILINAAKNGKKVTAIMEITARFDEENNMYWAQQMSEEGVKVIYGHPKYKVHSKIVYISKKINGKKVEYCNISTGNYNEVTADVYSDIALFTSNIKITKDVNNVFNYLETLIPKKFDTLIVSPFNIRSTIMNGIKNEIELKKNGFKSEIILKVNSLVDDEIIDALYKAIEVGVDVSLIVRGICCLSPEVKFDKKQPLAVSIIDKYLEHSRVYYFYNNGQANCYISSADMMSRNLDYRIEVGVPIFDQNILARILKYLRIQLSDNVKSRILNANMSNARYQKNSKIKVRSQREIFNWLEEENNLILNK